MILFVKNIRRKCRAKYLNINSMSNFKNFKYLFSFMKMYVSRKYSILDNVDIIIFRYFWKEVDLFLVYFYSLSNDTHTTETIRIKYNLHKICWSFQINKKNTQYTRTYGSKNITILLTQLGRPRRNEIVLFVIKCNSFIKQMKSK